MILLLMLCVGLIGANSLVLSPIAAEVAQGLGVGSAAEVMTAAAIYGFGVALSALFLAPRADRIGAPKALKQGLILVILGMAASGFAPSLLILSLGQGLTGAGVGIALPAIYSLAAIIAPKGKEARVMGLVLTGWTLSMVGGVTLAAFIADFWGWRSVFGLLGIGIVAIFVPVHYANFPPHTVSDVTTSPFSALQVPGILPALFSVLMLGTGFYGVYNFLGAHLTDNLSRNVSDAGLLTLSYGLGFGASTLLDPWLDRVGPRRGLLAVFSALGLYYLAMTFWSDTYYVLVAMMFGWGIVQHLGLNLTVGRLSQLDASQRGAVMGLNSTVMYLSVFGATLAFRPLFEGGGLTLCLIGASLLAFLGASEALFARLRARRDLILENS
ncbi:MFS transporter [uncultured Shimia sp.]|uniref:MFS transporter n=1 Tax=uncultured Shimia sp. TaxID=573152 RepID=UPI002608F782|nr:MFS transporter [uncultured Shimia sp.]